MEATLGAEVAARAKLAVGAKFAGAHGLGEGGDEHENEPYRVVGVLAPTGTVLDRLVLTSVESVWQVHEHGAPAGAPKELTALLIQYASPLAAATLPRMVNASSSLQAASPAYESARLFRMIGVGVDVLRAFGVVLMLAAGLSVFIALLNALDERRYDLAIMRMLGATPARLMGLMLLEGSFLAVAGGIAGVGLGHVLTEALGAALRHAQQAPVSGWAWSNQEWWLLAASLGVGMLAALIPLAEG